jgi:hypothetical protein
MLQVAPRIVTASPSKSQLYCTISPSLSVEAPASKSTVSGGSPLSGVALSAATGAVFCLRCQLIRLRACRSLDAQWSYQPYPEVGGSLRCR